MSVDVETHWVRPARVADAPRDQIFNLSDYDYTMPTFNIPMVAVYPFAGGVDKKVLVDSLKASLEQTLGQYVLFGGKLQVDEGTGRCLIKTSERDAVELTVKVHDGPGDEYMPTFSDLEKESFPPMRLENRKILPRVVAEQRSLTQYGDLTDDDAPVSMFMLTFIRGGLILGIGLHHFATDASGLDGFLQQWAVNTRNLAAGNPLAQFDSRILDRSQLTFSGPAPTAERFAELDRRVKCVKLLDEAPQPPPPDANMPETSDVLFHFPKSRIAALKLEASPTAAAEDPASPRWVSSYDVVMALCWRCMTRARLPALEMDTVSALMHAVNGRGRLDPPLPTYYVGNVAMHGRPELPVEEIVTGGAFPRLAGLVRATNNEIDGSLYTAATEWAAAVPDKRRIALNMRAYLGPDVGSTSWRSLTAHRTWDFGFGTPVAVRWPKPDLDGFVFYFPDRETGNPDQGVELVVCLENGAMRRLLRDEEWLRYAKATAVPSCLCDE